MNKYLVPLCVTAVTIFTSGIASAGSDPAPGNVPECFSAAYSSGTCRLPLKNGDFANADMSMWKHGGYAQHGGSPEGETWAALTYGGAMSQPVYAHTGKDTGASIYTLRFRMRAEHDMSEVRANLSMSTDLGEPALPLGFVTATAVTGEWNTVELSVQGKRFAAPAHVLVELENRASAIVQIDDLTLLESHDPDVELITR